MKLLEGEERAIHDIIDRHSTARRVNINLQLNATMLRNAPSKAGSDSYLAVESLKIAMTLRRYVQGRLFMLE
jgi:hypothetical protein